VGYAELIRQAFSIYDGCIGHLYKIIESRTKNEVKMVSMLQ
jgi:hypothetical protein